MTSQQTSSSFAGLQACGGSEKGSGMVETAGRDRVVEDGGKAGSAGDWERERWLQRNSGYRVMRPGTAVSHSPIT